MRKAKNLTGAPKVVSGPVRVRQWYYTYRGKERLAMVETSLGHGDDRTSFLIIKPGRWIFPNLGNWEYHEFVVESGSVTIGDEEYRSDDGITIDPGDTIFVEAGGAVLAR